MSLLKIQNLSVSYDGEEDVLKQVSFSMEEGERISIVGESGSGKSTLLQAVIGLLPAYVEITGGSICFREQIVWGQGPAMPAFVRGKDIGMIFQNAGEFADPIQKIGSQYQEMLRVHGIRSKSERAELQMEMLQKLRLYDTKRVLNAYPFELSGGMMQRVAIAMAMSLRPALLLADEPTSALDVTTQAQVAEQLIELNREYGTGLLLVTHNMGVADYVSDKIGVMYHGELVEFGEKDQIIHAPKHAYTKRLLEAAETWEM